MKRKNLKSLGFQKKIVATLATSTKLKGGTNVSGACTSSLDPHECYFACPDSLYAPCG